MGKGRASFLDRLSFERLEVYIFFGLVTLLLAQIWSVGYYLTTDGPCHLYNARILADIATGKNAELFAPFYTVNSHLEPNWFGHVVLGFFLLIFKPLLAEKLFLSAYVILFAVGARQLTSTIDDKNSWIAILALPLMYTTSFQMGFYNYSWSWVFYMIVVAYWLRHAGSNKWLYSGGLAILLIVLFFCHPIGYLMAGLTIAILIIFKLIRSKESGLAPWTMVRNTIVALLPSVLLLVNYALRKSLTPTPNPDGYDKLFIDFVELRSLIVLSQKETFWALCCAVLIGALVMRGLIVRFKLRGRHSGDGLLIAFICALLIYFFQPGGLAGAGILSFRLQFIPYLIAVFWLASLPYSGRVKAFVVLASFVSTAALTLARIPILRAADQAVAEYVSIGDSIPAGSVVLPLSFAHNGLRPNGEEVSGRIWLFVHASDYIAGAKPLIMLDNYEANTGNFPLLWKPSKNPYTHLSIGEGLEAEPPGVDVRRYEDAAGENIDFIITWGYDQADPSHPQTAAITHELTQHFELVTKSENEFAHLYRRRTN